MISRRSVPRPQREDRRLRCATPTNVPQRTRRRSRSRRARRIRPGASPTAAAASRRSRSSISATTTTRVPAATSTCATTPSRCGSAWIKPTATTDNHVMVVERQPLRPLQQQQPAAATGDSQDGSLGHRDQGRHARHPADRESGAEPARRRAGGLLHARCRRRCSSPKPRCASRTRDHLQARCIRRTRSRARWPAPTSPPTSSSASSSRSIPADYAKPFTPAQWARLQAIFPTGVCDWSKPGLEQQDLPGHLYLLRSTNQGGREMNCRRIVHILPDSCALSACPPSPTTTGITTGRIPP